MTHLHDLPTNAVLNYSLSPGLYEDSTTGQSVDLIAGDGNSFALIAGNVESGSEATTVTLQESSDLSTWTSIPNLTMPTIATDFDGVSAVNFRRTKRYVRASISVSNDFGANLAVLFGQQKKSV